MPEITKANTNTDAPAILRGKVLDQNDGQPLAGAMITLVGTELGAYTEVDGGYEIPEIPAGTYDVEVSYFGYQTKVISQVVFTNGTIIETPITLADDALTLEAVKVRTTLRQESAIALIVAQQHALQVTDGYGGDLIRNQTQGLYTSSALRRMPGVTLLEDRYLVIRGLAERYNTLLLNGSFLPISELDHQTFDFSTLPSSLISQIQLYKSATPDMISEFGGGIVKIATPDMPEGRKLQFTLLGEYNDLTSFKNFQKVPLDGKGFLGLYNKQTGIPQDLMGTQKLQSLYANDPFDSRILNAAKSIDPHTVASEGQAPMGSSFNLMYQNKWKLKEDKFLGLTTQLNVNDQYKYRLYYNNIVSSYDQEEGRNPIVDAGQYDYYRHTRGLSAMFNLAYQKTDRIKMSWKNLLNFNSNSIATENPGQYIDAFGNWVQYFYNPMRYTQQTMYASQINGTVRLNALEKPLEQKMNWLLFVNIFERSMPMYRAMNYTDTAGDGTFRYEFLTEDYLPYAYIIRNDQKDRIVGGSMDFELDLTKKTVLKLGTFANYRHRNFDARNLVLARDENYTLDEDVFLLKNIANLYNAQNFGAGGFTLADTSISYFEFEGQEYNAVNFNNYKAYALNLAPFAHIQYKPSTRLNLMAGIRVDSYSQQLISQAVHDNRELILVDNTKVDLLPSAGIIYKTTERANLRLNYCSTIARPDFREMSLYEYMDLENVVLKVGNPELQRTRINNFDLRYEIFPRATDLISFTLFYKQFENPVEEYMDPDTNTINTIKRFSVRNVKQAALGGFEIEFRHKFTEINSLKNFTLYGNMSLMQSRVNANSPTAIFNSDRPSLQGQSNYLINAGLLYEVEKTGTGIGLFYNRNGQRVAYVGNPYLPSYWELSRNILDVQITQKLGKKLTARLSLDNVLNEPIRVVQIYDGRKKYDANKDREITRSISAFSTYFSLTWTL